MKWKVLFLILGSACTVPALASSAQSVPVVTPVDNSVRVRIPHSTHPKARAEFDAGPVDGAAAMERMILVLGTSAEQEHEARTLVDSQQTKGSPDYHRWLTAEEFGLRFGPSEQEIQEVAGWLRQQGFTVNSVAKSRRWIEFSGTAAQVESAFQTRMRRYQVDGEVHTANATDISIPAALAPAVQGVVSLHDFYSKPALIPSNRRGTAKLAAGKPLIVAGDGEYAIGPQDFATIYDLNPLFNGTAPSPKTTPIDGTGQTIAIVAEGMINTVATTGLDDVANFRQIFSLPSNQANIILTGPGVTLDKVDGEATLDVEWAGSVAPRATIDLVVSAGTLATDPVDLSSIYVVDNNLAPIMNLSFSECEQDFGTAGNAFWNTLFEQAAAQGISVFVASGDWGAAGCEPDSLGTNNTALAVNGLSSTPYNTSVGGTEFDETVNGGTNATFWNGGTNLATGYIPEMVWNDCVTQCDYAAGGGISTIYPVPSWQTLPILGLTGAKFPNRALPDVSLAAAEGHDPYVYCFSSHAFDPDCQVRQGVVTFDNFAGGTSFASPEMAGVMALVGQATNSRQGLANYEFYALGAQESANFAACNSSNQTNPATRPGAQCVFNDVTAGTNGVPGNDTLSFVPPGDKTGQLGYNAVAGYDPASGLGSIDAAKLVNAWASAEAGFNGSSTALTASFNGTALPSNAVSIVHGQPVTITASVSALSGEKTQTPGAEIALLGEDGNLAANTGIASLPISGSGGTATTGAVSVKDLPAGTNYNLYAYFPGDGVFAGSTSNSIALSIAAENTTTALQSGIWNGTTVTAGNTLDYGDPANTLIFTVNVAGVSQLLPTTGTVTFTDNGNALATVPLGPDPGGIAQYVDGSASQGTLPLGTHVIGASYGGDGATPPSYNPSASGSVTVTVTKGNPQVVQVRAPSTAVAGQQVNLSTFLDYNYEAAAPTGTIQFMDGTTALGSPVTLIAANGTNAAITATFTTDGAHSITAQYSGDSNYNSATSPAQNLAITAPFALTATSTSQTIQQGQTATYNLTLTGTSFSGTVNLSCTSTNAPAGAQCSVPASETLSSSTTSVPFTVTVATTASAQTQAPPYPGGTLPLRLAAFLVVVFWGRKRIPRGMLLAVAVLAVFGMSACGGGSGQSSPPPPTDATYTITATSGSQTTGISLNLTINN